MFCTKCGKNLPDNAAFCSGCGNAFNSKAKKRKIKKQAHKKSKGNKLRVVSITVSLILIATAGTGSYLLYKYWTSPEQEIYREIAGENYKQAARMYNRNYSKDDDVPENIFTAVKKSLEEDYTAFLNGEKSYSEVTNDIDAITKMENEDVAAVAADILSSVNSLNTSRTAFESGNQFYNENDYKNAIQQYKLVIKDDTNYEEAQVKIEDSVNKYRESILSDAKAKADTEKIADAISIIESGLKVIENDSELTAQLNQYKSMKESADIKSVLDSAKSYADNTDYKSAITELEKSMKIYPDDASIQTQYASYQELYSKNVIAEADKYISENDYDAAENILTEAAGILPDDQTIADKLQKTKDERPIELWALKSQNADEFYFTDSSVEDVQGNLYAGENILIKGGNWISGYNVGSIEFYCGGEYKTLMFTLAPETSFASGKAITIEILTDDNSKKAIKVTQKMEPTQVAVDISGCQWLKIKASSIDGIGCDYTACILSNPVVKK